MSDGDYVLGTRDDEVARLGVQHNVWRGEMLEGFRLAGFGAGQTILDVGAGPGFASADLAELVGTDGRVIALERSPHFAATLRGRGLTNVEVREQDINEADFGTEIADGAWTRWVLAFVADPAQTVGHIAQALTRFEPVLRTTVKRAGFLTRDSRAVERKKYGKAKARKSFQFSKR